MPGGPMISWTELLAMLIATAGAVGTLVAWIVGVLLKKHRIEINSALDASEQIRRQLDAGKAKTTDDWITRIEKTVAELVQSVLALQREVFTNVKRPEYIADCKQVAVKMDEMGRQIVTLEVTVAGLHVAATAKEARDLARDARGDARDLRERDRK